MKYIKKIKRGAGDDGRGKVFVGEGVVGAGGGEVEGGGGRSGRGGLGGRLSECSLCIRQSAGPVSKRLHFKVLADKHDNIARHLEPPETHPDESGPRTPG